MINYAMTTKQPRLHRAEPDYYGAALHRYSTLIRLKVVPDQWRVEVICPVSKSGSPVCKTDDLRPIKLQEAGG